MAKQAQSSTEQTPAARCRRHGVIVPSCRAHLDAQMHHDTRLDRQVSAGARHQDAASVSVKERLDVLDRRLGPNKGAKRERAKLAAKAKKA